MTKEEQIQALSKVLLKLLEEAPENPQITPNLETKDSKERHEQHVKTINETLNDFKGLGVDVDVIRQIMRRVDEVYGHKRSLIYTKPLYEDFDDLTKNKVL